MANLKMRLEVLTNGTTITNRATGQKEMAQNGSKIQEYVKNFVAEQIENGTPGEYFDLDIIITKQKNKKPS